MKRFVFDYSITAIDLYMLQIRACNLYQAPGGDFEVRERVHQKYIPDEPFVDHCSAQLPYDEEVEVPFEDLVSGVSSEVVALSAPDRMESFHSISDARPGIIA